MFGCPPRAAGAALGLELDEPFAAGVPAPLSERVACGSLPATARPDAVADAPPLPGSGDDDEPRTVSAGLGLCGVIIFLLTTPVSCSLDTALAELALDRPAGDQLPAVAGDPDRRCGIRRAVQAVVRLAEVHPQLVQAVHHRREQLHEFLQRRVGVRRLHGRDLALVEGRCCQRVPAPLRRLDTGPGLIDVEDRVRATALIVSWADACEATAFHTNGLLSMLPPVTLLPASSHNPM